MKNKITLSENEKEYLQDIGNRGSNLAKVIKRAHILLLSDKGKTVNEISDFLDVAPSSIWRTKKKYCEGGVEYAVHDKDRPGLKIVYNDKIKAEVITLACSEPPNGRCKWTLELLTEEMRKKDGSKKIGKETIRLILKKTNVNPGLKKCGVSPK